MTHIHYTHNAPLLSSPEHDHALQKFGLLHASVTSNDIKVIENDNKMLNWAVKSITMHSLKAIGSQTSQCVPTFLVFFPHKPTKLRLCPLNNSHHHKQSWKQFGRIHIWLSLRTWNGGVCWLAWFTDIYFISPFHLGSQTYFCIIPS